MEIAHRCFENAAQFRYLGKTITKNKTWFRTKLRRDLTWVIVATIQCRTFCLLVSCLKT
jgi:hypothetical protein